MSSQAKATLLLLTLSSVGVLRTVSAYPAGDSRLFGRQTRSVHYADPYGPCERNGFRVDLQKTIRTIIPTNRTLNIMKVEVFQDTSYDPGFPAPLEDDIGLVPLFRILGNYNRTLQAVSGEAHGLESYSPHLQGAMNHTKFHLKKMLVKLKITLRAAGELGDSLIPLGETTVDPEETTYQLQVRHFIIFQHLCETLELLKARLETRLAEC